MSDSEPTLNGTPFPAGLDIAAVVAAFIPFVCNFGTSSTSTVNGRVVEESHFDLVATLAGAVAIVLALAIVFTLIPNTAEDDRLKRYGVVVLAIAIGAYQIAVRGLDLI